MVGGPRKVIGGISHFRICDVVRLYISTYGDMSRRAKLHLTGHFSRKRHSRAWPPKKQVVRKQIYLVGAHWLRCSLAGNRCCPDHSGIAKKSLGGSHVTTRTKRIIIALYWNWCGRGRENGGRSYSLADYLVQIQSDRNKRAKGVPSLTLEQHAWAVGLPLSVLETWAAALDEGVSYEELKELNEVRAPTKPFIPS